MSQLQLLYIPSKILLGTAIWPKTNPSFSYRLRNWFTRLNLILLTICLTYNAAGYRGDVIKFSESLYMLFSVLNSLVKTEMICFNGDRLLRLLGMLQKRNFQQAELDYAEVFRHYHGIVKRFTTVYLAIVNSAIVLFILHPVMGSKALPLDFPHFNNGTYHIPFFIFESFSLALAAYQNVGADLLVNVVILMAAIQLRILNRKLIDSHENVKKSGHGDAEMLSYLNDCCVHYSDIEDYVKCIIEVFTVHISMQLGASVVAICNSGIMILTAKANSVEVISLAYYFIGMITELWMYCWFGNQVLVESAEVLTSCYLTNWYEHGTAVRKTLFMLMERSKKPLQIKGFRYVNLSFVTFIAILKWSYSYFALLRNYTMKDNN